MPYKVTPSQPPAALLAAFVICRAWCVNLGTFGADATFEVRWQTRGASPLQMRARAGRCSPRSDTRSSAYRGHCACNGFGCMPCRNPLETLVLGERQGLGFGLLFNLRCRGGRASQLQPASSRRALAETGRAHARPNTDTDKAPCQAGHRRPGGRRPDEGYMYGMCSKLDPRTPAM